MKLKGSDILLNTEGKGLLGCMVGIILTAAIVFVGLKLGPVYYSNMMFEEDIKTVTSRAGSRGMKNDLIIRDILELAKKNEISLTSKDVPEKIKIERYAGQVHVEIRYSVPVDLWVLRKDFEFEVTASSFSSF